MPFFLSHLFFDVVFIFEVFFIYEVVLIFDVLFIFEVVFIFEVLMTSYHDVHYVLCHDVITILVVKVSQAIISLVVLTKRRCHKIDTYARTPAWTNKVSHRARHLR